MTVLTKGFQLSHFRYWMANTIGAIFKNKHVTAHTHKDDRAISQFQSLCTALAVLTSGLVDLNTGAVLTTTEKTAMVAEAFGLHFGAFGNAFIAIVILLFAFSTVLGWSHYGTKAFEYLFGTKAAMYYKVFCLLYHGGRYHEAGPCLGFERHL